MRVAGLVRVSTEEQANDGVSLRAQTEKIRLFCQLHELELVEICEDAGFSGKTLDRPGLQQALAMLRSGQVDGLVVAKIDRLSRSVVDWNTLVDCFFSEKAGKSLFSVADSIDTRTAAGRMVLNIIVVIGQWEREVVVERTRDALQDKIRNSERVGEIRYGYDLAEDGVHLVENTSEQEVIAMMEELRSERFSYRKIANTLIGRRLATKEGKPWSAMAVHRILNRRVKPTANGCR